MGHVLANSDREYDQELKLKVRDAVLEYLRPGMEKCESREEAEEYLAAHIYGINSTAERVINEEGYEYDVKTELSKEHYPVRYYANAAFPEGVYQSLRVTIGKGEGHNWWCVMYPPLCLNGQRPRFFVDLLFVQASDYISVIFFYSYTICINGCNKITNKGSLRKTFMTFPP